MPARKLPGQERPNNLQRTKTSNIVKGVVRKVNKDNAFINDRPGLKRVSIL